MAIAYDNATVNLSIGSTSNSTSHTATGSNIIALVGIFSTAGDTLTGITYDSNAMSLIRKRVGLTGEQMYLYYILSPATGAKTVAASFSGSTTSRMHILTLTGAAQSGIPDAQTDTTSASTTSQTVNLTTIADNCWTVLFTRSNGTITAGSGSTERPSAASSTSAIFDSNAAKTPAGSTSMAASISPTSQTSSIMVSIAPFVASTLRLLASTGVGT